MELERLRGNRIDSLNKVLKGGSTLDIVGVTAAQVGDFPTFTDEYEFDTCYVIDIDLSLFVY